MRLSLLPRIAIICSLSAAHLVCLGSTDDGPRLSVTVGNNVDGVQVTTLSVAPTVATIADVRPITPDLVVGLTDADAFGSAVDVAAEGTGRFAVLDRMERRVRVFDSSGQAIGSFGRRGDGPGEFSFPVAIEWLKGGKLIVWDVSPTKTFTAFSSGGAVEGTTPQPIPGDWARLSFRHPSISRDGFQMGPEEVTRRLGKVHGSHFLHLVQQDELTLAALDPSATAITPMASLVRYASDLSIVDTIATMSGVRYLSRKDLEVPGIARQFEQPLFAAHPLWAAGEDWIALAHGDSASIRILGSGGEVRAEVQWPHAAEPVSEADKLSAADWIIRVRIENSAESRRMYEQASRRERREAVRGTAFDLTTFAENRPQLTGLYGFDECLLIAGFSARDHHDGHSQTMLVINVASGALEGVVRFGLAGARIKAIDQSAAYALRRGQHDVSLVERYPLPGFRCSADPGQFNQSEAA